MNTPGHSILNLAILNRAQLSGQTWPILIGSWLPDAALFVFFAWGQWAQIPPQELWGQQYYAPVWQDIFAVGNSMPLALLSLGLCLWWRRWRLVALFASMLLHQLEDLPLHHDDAHRHFWPLTDYRLISPISYWDRDHLGAYGALLELVLIFVASLTLRTKLRSRWSKTVVVAINLLYLIAYYGQFLRPND